MSDQFDFFNISPRYFLNITEKHLKGSEVDASIFLLNVFDIILAALFSVQISIKIVQ